MNAVVVGSGGFLGAVARYGLSGLVHRQVPLATFPYGTLLVNLLGCLAIGVITGLAESRQLFGPEIRMFLLIGILFLYYTFWNRGSKQLTGYLAYFFVFYLIHLSLYDYLLCYGGGQPILSYDGESCRNRYRRDK